MQDYSEATLDYSFSLSEGNLATATKTTGCSHFLTVASLAVASRDEHGSLQLCSAVYASAPGKVASITNCAANCRLNSFLQQLCFVLSASITSEGDAVDAFLVFAVVVVSSAWGFRDILCNQRCWCLR